MWDDFEILIIFYETTCSIFETYFFGMKKIKKQESLSFFLGYAI